MPANTPLTFVDSNRPDAGKKGMKEMCLNILMEAEEKCEEIDVKCEEEYSALKLKEIIEQRGKVKKIMEKRQADVQREFRVHITKLYNQARLAQLKAKNDIVKQIMDEVKRKLSRERGHNYVKLIKHSMTQALFMLMEPEVKVVCKKSDKDLVADCFRDVGKAYEKKTLLHTKISFSEEHLPDKNTGGVIVCDSTNAVSVDCLIDSRVEQVCRQAMPLIVELLFADVKISEVVREPLKASSSVRSTKEIEEKSLIRMTRSPVPPREEGMMSSTIALPISPTSSGSVAFEPTTSSAPGARQNRKSTESMESATPSPTRVAGTPTPSLSPPHPPEQDENPKQKK